MERIVLIGNSVSAGIAIGKAFCAFQLSGAEHVTITIEAVSEECARLRQAVTSVLEDLELAQKNVPDELREHREIIKAHMLICQDAKLLGEAIIRIEERRMAAPWALEETVESLCTQFHGMEDSYLRDRAHDVRAVGGRIMACLTGTAAQRKAAERMILVARSLSPADAFELDVNKIMSLVTAEGGRTSHTAILARSLHIPAVVGVSGLSEAVQTGSLMIVDGFRGRIIINPEDAELAEYAELQDTYVQYQKKIRKTASEPCVSQDGIPLAVGANIESVEELPFLEENGAAGVGLYRTEYAYLARRELPTEDDLFLEYATVASSVAPARVVFRTLDIGSDKMLESRSLSEPNPALGLRGIRFCLRHQNIFRTHLRAILRAGLHGDVAMMLPMISCVDEVRKVRAIIMEVQQDLTLEGIPFASDMPVGIMIELPSAVLAADALAREADFFSIGTNDLIQYSLGVDRDNRHVASLFQSLHPAIVRSLKMVIDSAHQAGIPIAVCGELGGDPYGLALLLGLRVDTVSVPPSAIPGVKHLLRHLDSRECAQLVTAALCARDASTINRMVREMLNSCLPGEMDFYTSLVEGNG